MTVHAEDIVILVLAIPFGLGWMAVATAHFVQKVRNR